MGAAATEEQAQKQAHVEREAAGDPPVSSAGSSREIHGAGLLQASTSTVTAAHWGTPPMVQESDEDDDSH